MPRLLRSKRQHLTMVRHPTVPPGMACQQTLVRCRLLPKKPISGFCRLGSRLGQLFPLSPKSEAPKQFLSCRSSSTVAFHGRCCYAKNEGPAGGMDLVSVPLKGRCGKNHHGRMRIIIIAPLMETKRYMYMCVYIHQI